MQWPQPTIRVFVASKGLRADVATALHEWNGAHVGRRFSLIHRRKRAHVVVLPAGGKTPGGGIGEADVGFRPGHVSRVWISRWLEAGSDARVETLVHEFGHVLGLWDRVHGRVCSVMTYSRDDSVCRAIPGERWHRLCGHVFAIDARIVGQFYGRVGHATLEPCALEVPLTFDGTASFVRDPTAGTVTLHVSGATDMVGLVVRVGKACGDGEDMQVPSGQLTIPVGDGAGCAVVRGVFPDGSATDPQAFQAPG